MRLQALCSLFMLTCTRFRLLPSCGRRPTGRKDSISTSTCRRCITSDMYTMIHSPLIRYGALDKLLIACVVCGFQIKNAYHSMQSSWIFTARNNIADLFDLNAHSSATERLAAVNALLLDYTFIYRDSDRELPPAVVATIPSLSSFAWCLMQFLATYNSVFRESNPAIHPPALLQQTSRSTPGTLQLVARRAASYSYYIRGYRTSSRTTGVAKEWRCAPIGPSAATSPPPNRWLDLFFQFQK